MRRRIKLLFIGCLFTIAAAHSQYKIQSFPHCTETMFTGSLSFDLAQQSSIHAAGNSADTLQNLLSVNQYSPLRASLYSGIIPGAGQLYTKNYWQSAAFFGAEVLMWVLYSKYENDGDRRTDAFQRYADEHWSVVRYARWIKNNPEPIYSRYYSDAIINGNPPDDVVHPWEYINWQELNASEEKIGQQKDSGFSHRLEQYGEQQYYEMIGKYQQFGGGWDDAATFKTGGFTWEDIKKDPANVSPRFLAYSQMRGDANSSYNIATTVSYVIVANHVFSALEAAWNASSINHKIHLEGHIQSRALFDQRVEFVPTVHVQYEL